MFLWEVENSIYTYNGSCITVIQIDKNKHLTKIKWMNQKQQK